MLGLPNEIAGYVLAMLLICVPVSFFAPLAVSFPRKRESRKRNGTGFLLSQERHE
jgi:hypothetical protein